MRILITLTILGSLVSALSCTSGGPTPVAPSVAPSSTPTPIALGTGSAPEIIPVEATLGVPLQLGEATTAAVGLWQLRLDPDALTATIEPTAGRALTAFGDNYFLDVTHFFQPNLLTVTRVRRTDTAVEIDYTLRHPFAPASDPNAPASATNRADLGFAGLLLFLIDTTPDAPTYFNERPESEIIRANLQAIANADGYIRPQQMLDTSTALANTFPFRRLVDDSGAGNRLDHPNIAPGIGNFGAQSGWQRYNWGADRASWTGYGMLHQGQTVTNTVALSLAALQAGPVSLNLALLAKHVDPVGGGTVDERIANRLPTTDQDRSKFLYRMPHGAWDLEQIRVLNQPTLPVGTHVQDTLQIYITDWDARATPQTTTNYAEDLVATHVRLPEVGLPALALSLPAGLGATTLSWTGQQALRDDDRAYGGDLGPDSGGAHDPLFFDLYLTVETPFDMPSGPSLGLLSATDAIASTPHAEGIVLNADLQPIGDAAGAMEIFQVVVLQVEELPLTNPLEMEFEVEPVVSGTTPKLRLLSYRGDTPTPPGIVVQFDWDRDGVYTSETMPTGWPQTVGHATKFSNPTIEAQELELPYRVRKLEENRWEAGRYAYILGPNRPPELMSPVLNATALPSPAQFEILPGWFRDPEGDPVSVTVTNDANSDVVEASEFPFPLHLSPLTHPETSVVKFTVRVHDPLHPGDAGALVEFYGRVLGPDPPGALVVVPSNTNQNLGQHLDIDSAGNSYVTGLFNQTIDLGAGPVTPVGQGWASFLVSHDAAGKFRWAQIFDGAGLPGISWTYLTTVATTTSGEVRVAGIFTEPVDFGGGLRTPAVTGELAVAAFTTEGVWIWDRQWPITPSSLGRIVLGARSGGGCVVALYANMGTFDAGGGPRTITSDRSTVLIALDATGTYEWDRVFTGGEFLTYSLAESGPRLFVGGVQKGAIDYGGGMREVTGSCGGVIALNSFTGDWEWDRVYTTGSLVADVVALTGGAIVAGGSTSTSTDFGGGLMSAGSFAVRYSGTGAWEWHVSAGYKVHFSHLAVSSLGDLVVGGVTPDPLDFGFGEHDPPPFGNDAFVVSYRPDGTARWADWWSSTSSDWVAGLSSTPDGRLVAMILHDRVLDADPGPTVVMVPPYLSRLSPFMSRLQPDAGLWD